MVTACVLFLEARLHCGLWTEQDALEAEDGLLGPRHRLDQLDSLLSHTHTLRRNTPGPEEGVFTGSPTGLEGSVKITVYKHMNVPDVCEHNRSDVIVLSKTRKTQFLLCAFMFDSCEPVRTFVFE